MNLLRKLVSIVQYGQFFRVIIIVLVCANACVVFSDSNHAPSCDESCEKSWNQGIKLLASGEISNGLNLLDSLCSKGVDNPEELSVYARKVFKVLCNVEKKELPVTIKSNLSPVIVFDSLFPSSYKWKVVSSTGATGRLLPSFGFSASYPIQKPFLLKFTGLQSHVAPRLKIDHDIVYTTIDSDLEEQLFNRDDSISCSIYIDLKNTKLTIYDYIRDYVYGIYDSIAIKNDLKKYNALSLRCYKRKAYGFENGKFTAIIAFDRLLPDRKNKKKSSTVTPLPVRYTVIVQSPASVRDLAEAKLQTIINTL